MQLEKFVSELEYKIIELGFLIDKGMKENELKPFIFEQKPSFPTDLYRNVY